ncbi:alpha/beta hydrolase [Lignipirellula cremea]|uniref:Carboxylesterase NlhH n=1 Tax=Lignipirellula cremea TaxID=2528010 RepID=A0A518DLG6_9BACT|nr:alpha/beta hydrolase [Lignipirellula cremea]QDU92677.1 Carboxylesterase NlhH [Lignipirellula cremea]
MSADQIDALAPAESAQRQVQAFLDKLNTSGDPPLETLPPEEARQVLSGLQSSTQGELRPAEVSQHSIEADGKQVRLTIVRPPHREGPLPAFMFFHGGGWVLGDYPTHERLIRDLVAESDAAAVYVDYSRSPEARFPTAIDEAYLATQWIAANGAEVGIDGSRLAVAGNSVGGNMAAVVALRSVLEDGPKLRMQMLLWPVTDARFDTVSYERFANDHFLTRAMMVWFWNSYATTAGEREGLYASPLRATHAQMRNLPPAVIQTAELDVLRDEGEAYARKLDEAGVEVVALRVNGMIHDYGLLNPLAELPAVQSALRQAAHEIKRRLA